MGIKVIFIDIDNTILDFDEYVRQSMKAGFEEFGLRAYEPWMYDVFTAENNKLWHGIEDGTLDFEQLQKIRWNHIFEKLGISFDGPTFERYFRRCLNESAIEIEGACQMLEELGREYVLCTASNGPYEQQIHRLELADMKKYFSHMFISEDLGASKPAAEFFERAFERLNNTLKEPVKAGEEPVKPEECLMIGDSLTSDVAGGRNAGMKTCYFARGKEASGDEADIVVDSLSEIVEMLKKLK